VLARLLRAVFIAARSTALVLLGATACGSQSVSAPRLIGEGRRILFVGNSLTYVNDLPGIVQALADSAGGDRLAVATVAGPDLALVDHWNEGTSRREIAKVSARPRALFRLADVGPAAGFSARDRVVHARRVGRERFAPPGRVGMARCPAA
jgi:hypothetical protein